MNTQVKGQLDNVTVTFKTSTGLWGNSVLIEMLVYFTKPVYRGVFPNCKIIESDEIKAAAWRAIQSYLQIHGHDERLLGRSPAAKVN